MCKHTEEFYACISPLLFRMTCVSLRKDEKHRSPQCVTVACTSLAKWINHAQIGMRARTAKHTQWWVNQKQAIPFWCHATLRFHSGAVIPTALTSHHCMLGRGALHIVQRAQPSSSFPEASRAPWRTKTETSNKGIKISYFLFLFWIPPPFPMPYSHDMSKLLLSSRKEGCVSLFGLNWSTLLFASNRTTETPDPIIVRTRNDTALIAQLDSEKLWRRRKRRKHHRKQRTPTMMTKNKKLQTTNKS